MWFNILEKTRELSKKVYENYPEESTQLKVDPKNIHWYNLLISVNNIKAILVEKGNIEEFPIFWMNLPKSVDMLLDVELGERGETDYIGYDGKKYYAKPSAEPGNFYRYGEEIFYIAVDEEDLKSKVELWDNEEYINDPDKELEIEGKNGTFSIPVNRIIVTNVDSMSTMFYPYKFNQDISNWDVSNVITMYGMFFNSEFNQDISNWDVSNVTDMTSMFSNSEFNQDISNWCVENIFAKPSGFDQKTDPNWTTGMKPKWGEPC